MRIVIVDYGIGNVRSMYNAVRYLGENPVLSYSRSDILGGHALILPGVGAFRKGMENLRNRGLIETIHDFVSTGKPFLGVCLGMQMMLQESEEFGNTEGLGLIQGKVVRMPSADGNAEKLPHVGWNMIEPFGLNKWEDNILAKVQERTNVYFVHSFVAVPEHSVDVLAMAEYRGLRFCAALHRDNIYGVQFHPEKSGPCGLMILENFINIAKK